MSEWQKVKLGDVCDKVADGTHDSPKQSIMGKPLATSKNIVNRVLNLDNCYLISHDDYKEINKRSKVDRYDVLISMIGTVGAVCYIKDEPNFAIKNVGLLKNRDQIKSKYLFYFLQSPIAKDIISSRLRGTTQQYLPLGELRNLPILMPDDYHEMERIAEILSSLDDKIENNRAMCKTLEAMAQALFKSWFIDFEPFQDGEFIDSPLGKIPKGWKVGNFTDVINVSGGGTPKTDNENYWNGDIPFFTPKDVNSSVYSIITQKYITQQGIGNCNSPLYPANTVFVTARGTVGKIALSGTAMAMNQSCYALSGKNDLSPFVVYHLTLHSIAKLKNKASGAVFDAIVTRDFDSEKTILSPASVFAKFADAVSPMYSKILNNTIENQRLSELRDSLLSKLMSRAIEI